jgi:SAM-dependent methyltransferase
VNPETQKAHERRVVEGWYAKYAPPDVPGIDIGSGYSGNDAIHPTYRVWDTARGDGDPTHMAGVPDDSYAVVYASHVLEHLRKPNLAIQNWYRVTKPGGTLIIMVPHRELYERRRVLPSRWNNEHESYWLPETDEPLVTFGLRAALARALGPEVAATAEIVTLDFNHEIPDDDGHSLGEYSIEARLVKPAI